MIVNIPFLSYTIHQTKETIPAEPLQESITKGMQHRSSHQVSNPYAGKGGASIPSQENPTKLLAVKFTGVPPT